MSIIINKNTTVEARSTDIVCPGRAPGLDNRFRRLLIISSAAFLPFILTVLLTGLFYLTGDYQVTKRVAASTTFAEITQPQAAKTVGDVFTAQGVLKALPENKVAYLAVARGQYYWPKHYFGQAPGQWSKEIREKKYTGKPLRLVVLAVDDAGKQRIDQWYGTNKQTGKYPGLSEAGLSGVSELAQLEVKQ